MLRDIWLVQPLAFARGGSSPEPLDAFDWGEPDLSPDGTGRTQITPADTLIVDRESGDVSLKPAAQTKEVIFKDNDGRIRPVCPFFELHGLWDENGREVAGPVTPAVLEENGKRAADLEWRVEFHNNKAAHWTKAQGDRVFAEVEMRGDCCTPQPLRGHSLWGAIEPLVPIGRHIPLGSVQLTRPNKDFQEFRLRFTPGEGRAYAPSNFQDRLANLTYPAEGENAPAGMLPFVWALVAANNKWKGFKLPPAQCFLNPNAAWPKYAMFSEADVGPAVFEMLSRLVSVDALVDDQSQLLRFLLGGESDSFDVRNLPPGLYARVAELPNLLASLGMIDDFGDGLISCELKGVGVAYALTDRSRRADTRDIKWVSGANAQLAELEIQDLMDRAFETMGLANVDATDDYFQKENVNHQKRNRPSADEAWGNEKLWTDNTPITGERAAYMHLARDERWEDPLPLTSLGRDAHRRNAVRIFFEALVLKYPDFMKKFVRVPAGPDRSYDRKMPGLMRGGDRMPLHLTRRQYDLLDKWVQALRGRSK
jgi:hypothetical protein